MSSVINKSCKVKNLNVSLSKLLYHTHFHVCVNNNNNYNHVNRCINTYTKKNDEFTYIFCCSVC